MRNLQGKIALITGAASGIGREIALALARRGTHLHLLDINEAGLAEVAGQIGPTGVKVQNAVCDVSDSGAISKSVDDLLRHWGKIDILVNNAGIAYYGPTEVMRDEQWDRLLAINLLAPVRFTRALLPSLLAQQEAHILNVCSIAGLVASRKLAAYDTSKFGLVGFSMSLRAEYWRRGLGVTALCPGFVRTNIYQAAMHGDPEKSGRVPPRWLSCPTESVAACAVRAIRRNKGLVPVTWLTHLMWRLQRLSPAMMDVVSRGRLWRKSPAAKSPTPNC